MNNFLSKNSNENPLVLVTAYMEEPNLLQILVEELAECNCGLDYGLKSLLLNWQSIEFSSVETFVSGRIIISAKNDLIKTSFGNRFLFTCTRSAKTQFNLTWSHSLS